MGRGTGRTRYQPGDVVTVLSEREPGKTLWPDARCEVRYVQMVRNRKDSHPAPLYHVKISAVVVHNHPRRRTKKVVTFRSYRASRLRKVST